MKLHNPDRLIFVISGGTGKNIMATGVVEAARKQFPESEIIIATPWTEVWLNNPHINRLVNFIKEPGLYKNFVNKPNTAVFLHDVYHESSFIHKQKHLNESWADMCGIKYNGEAPKLYFTDAERAVTKAKLPQDGKPLFFIQTCGGAQNQDYPISWMRDMPLSIAQRVVDRMNALGYTTVHLRRPDQYALAGTVSPIFTVREMLCSIEFSDKRLFIDSVAEHAAAALGKPSVIVWTGNRPGVFGYTTNANLLPRETPKFRHKIDSYLEPYNITGIIHECPYDTDELFDVEEILTCLKRLN